MKIKVLIIAIVVLGSFEINSMFRKTIVTRSQDIVNMAGLADFVSLYGYKVHKCSHTELFADKESLQIGSVQKECIKINVLPSMFYFVQTKHEVFKKIFDCGNQVEEVLDVYQKTAIVDGFDLLAETIKNYLNGY